MEHLVGENQRFVESYEDYADAIFRFCYFKIYNRELARDLMQESYLRAWEYVVKGKKVDNLRAFLYKIANNLCIDHIRRKKETSLDTLLDEGFDHAGEGKADIERKTDASIAIESIRSLDETYRDVMIMRFVDDLSVKEIAEVTGETENTISVRLHRGTAMLKEKLT